MILGLFLFGINLSRKGKVTRWLVFFNKLLPHALFFGGGGGFLGFVIEENEC